MQHAVRVLFFGFAASMLTARPAFAGDVVVPPILARGAPSQTADNMTTLVASELEFTGEFETVNQLSKRPSQLGTNCLKSSPCLAGIAKSGGGSTLIAGKVTKYGAEYEVALTFLENGKIVRVVKRRMPTDPSAVADQIAFLVRHAVTGVDPAEKAAEDKVSGFEGGGIALMDDEEDEDDEDLLLAAPVVPLPADPIGPDDPDLFGDTDPNEGDDFPIEAGVAGGGIDRVDPPSEDPFNPDEISFGDSGAEGISFGSASGIIEVEEEDPVEPETRYSDDLDEAPAPVRTPRQRAKREPKPRTKREPKPRTRTPKKRTPRERTPRARGPQRSSDSSIDLTGRVGFAKFQFLNFLTYGVEAGMQLSPNFALLGGLEAYSTRREIPPELVPEGLPAVQWNTLIPLHVSGVYRPEDGTVRPFFGGGLQLIPGYVKGAQSVAFGLRGIGGMDYQVSDNFGVSVSGSAGFWAGTEWYLIQNLMNTGFSAQISAGAVLAF